MKNLVLPSLAVLLLAGCSTTPNQMREDAPSETHISKKQPKEIMLCIADSWEDHSVVNTRETRTGYAVSAFLSDGKLRYLADVEVEKSVTVTRLYRWRVLAIGRDAMFKFAEDCQ
ncbi:hypothetical protein [Marinobacter algicola]|uniref:hypothetical protein n=1 Tax=Marinobacter algicola TaxID=236100 RepID=UPI003BA8BFC2